MSRLIVPNTLFSHCLLLLSATCIALPAPGQATDATATAASKPALPAAEQSDVDPLAIFRAPLLREGSSVVEATATIQHDSSRGMWKLLIEQPGNSVPQHDLFLLPCTRLSEMQRLVEASPTRKVEFQVTGRVFVFRGRNYVLPTHAPVFMEQEDPETQAAPNEGVAAETPPDASTPASATNETEKPGKHDSAADIMRDLKQAAGPIVRSPVLSNVAAERRETSDAAASTRPERTLSEDTSIVNRRGKITRDSAGGWMFIFDADASGLADPPLRLMPCLLLERIEDYARRQGNNSPALLSGPVYLYEGHNYLLPTVFRIPQERRNLTP